MFQKILVVSLFLTITKYSVGQKYVFSSNGIMENSKLYIDTVIKSNLKINGTTIFSYLDNNYSDTLNIRQFFLEKYDNIKKDNLEYFFVINLSDKDLNFKKLDNHLIAEELGRFENFGFKPLNFFRYPRCGTKIDFSDLVLKPSEILIIKNLIKRKPSKIIGEPNCFMKLMLNSNVSLISSAYRKSINNKSFYLNSKYQKDFEYMLKSLAFEGK